MRRLFPVLLLLVACGGANYARGQSLEDAQDRVAVAYFEKQHCELTQIATDFVLGQRQSWLQALDGEWTLYQMTPQHLNDAIFYHRLAGTFFNDGKAKYHEATNHKQTVGDPNYAEAVRQMNLGNYTNAVYYAIQAIDAYAVAFNKYVAANQDGNLCHNALVDCDIILRLYRPMGPPGGILATTAE